MKKIIRALAAFLILTSLVGCGSTAAETADMNGIYQQMTAAEGMPEMLVVPAEKAVTFFGIAQEDCAQAVTAICQNSLRADEIWLVEALDAAAAGRIAALARTRLEQKSSELKSYAPEQYEIVQNAKLIESGRCVALIVSPMADALEGMLGADF